MHFTDEVYSWTHLTSSRSFIEKFDRLQTKIAVYKGKYSVKFKIKTLNKIRGKMLDANENTE